MAIFRRNFIMKNESIMFIIIQKLFTVYNSEQYLPFINIRSVFTNTP